MTADKNQHDHQDIFSGQDKRSATTLDEGDRARFEALGAEWWKPNGPMKPLHLFAPVRLSFFQKAILRAGLISPDQKAELSSKPLAYKPLEGLHVLDIGCGGGILAEPMARLGAKVTGLDGSAAAIESARAHAKSQNLEITYRNQTSEELVDEVEKNGAPLFDVVYASEVIEHVADRRLFLCSMAKLLKPGGVAILTTINRNLASFAFAKMAAEYLLRLVPPGTHNASQFVKPEELRAEAGAAGLDLDYLTGFVPLPDGRFKMAPITAVNYGIAGQKRIS
ncbi:MAG: bifunctional 2-polyprenyl-6-hydroxyphenol methylase/3-demethylubiquinol 3-O-methyltransferase UbiG [Candidatus Puniceispirillaceae bacterium]